jgi:putative ATP-dependent endonuclease of OLD family
MLTRLQVKNFRSLEAVDLPLGQLVALVGPNGAGKTSILRAIDLVAGETWPTLRSFRVPQDFTAFDPTRDVEIRLAFDPAHVHRDTLSTERAISELRVTCKPYRRTGKWGDVGDLHVDFDALDAKGEVPRVATSRPAKGLKPSFDPLRVGTDIRDQARILFIDHRRSLAQHHPWQRGSILGRLLQPARKEFTDQEDFKKAYEQAMDLLRTARVKSIESAVATTTKRMLGFLGTDRSEGVEIGFGFSDPANPFGSLRLQYRESGLTVPGDELGLGIQSAMVVGVFEAFRQLGTTVGTLVIEEPEMYLHPQAQRYFYRLLLELAESKKCQVIYSTHSPIFAEVDRFEALRVVRRETSAHTDVRYVRQIDYALLEQARNALKIGGKFDTSRNEVLFARGALLVEGYGDRLAAAFAAEKMGLDVDAEGLAIVDCSAKTGIDLVVRVCKALGIPFVVLHDEDIWPIDPAWPEERRKRQRDENDVERQRNEALRDVIGNEGYCCVISPTLEHLLSIGRNASDKPRRVLEALRALDFAELPSAFEPVARAVSRLRDIARARLVAAAAAPPGPPEEDVQP